MEDKFLGFNFKNKKGNTITVLSRLEDGDYKVECSKCSKDTELFKNGFKSKKERLLLEQSPCACTIYRWSEEQQIIRVNRVCKEKGYIFKGFQEGFKKNQTRVFLYNPKTNNSWNAFIADVLNKGNGDPVEGRERSRLGSVIPDEKHLEGFSSKYKKGTIFGRSVLLNSKGNNILWSYWCPSCSVDQYTKAGVCSGVFTSVGSHFKVGRVVCRCNPSYRYNAEQVEFYIRDVFSIEGGSWVGWVSGYRNARSKFKWLCPDLHECSTTVNDFKTGSRCITCSDGNCRGFYPKRVDELDTFYILLVIGKEYFKIGRSFDCDRRLPEHSKTIDKYYKTKIPLKYSLKLTASHKQVYEFEQNLLYNYYFSNYSDFKVKSYGSSETVNNKYLLEVTTFCTDYFSEYWK